MTEAENKSFMVINSNMSLKSALTLKNINLYLLIVYTKPINLLTEKEQIQIPLH